MSQYYVGKPGENPTGPFTEEAILKGMADGTFPPDSKAWKEGMDSWLTLAELFGSAPGHSVPVKVAEQTVVIPLAEPLPQSSQPQKASPVPHPVKKRSKKKKLRKNVNIDDEMPPPPATGNNLFVVVGGLLVVAGVLIICIPDVLNQYLQLW